MNQAPHHPNTNDQTRNAEIVLENQPEAGTAADKCNHLLDNPIDADMVLLEKLLTEAEELLTNTDNIDNASKKREEIDQLLEKYPYSIHTSLTKSTRERLGKILDRNAICSIKYFLLKAKFFYSKKDEIHARMYFEYGSEMLGFMDVANPSKKELEKEYADLLFALVDMG